MWKAGKRSLLWRDSIERLKDEERVLTNQVEQLLNRINFNLIESAKDSDVRLMLSLIQKVDKAHIAATKINGEVEKMEEIARYGEHQLNSDHSSYIQDQLAKIHDARLERIRLEVSEAVFYREENYKAFRTQVSTRSVLRVFHSYMRKSRLELQRKCSNKGLSSEGSRCAMATRLCESEQLYRNAIQDLASLLDMPSCALKNPFF